MTTGLRLPGSATGVWVSHGVSPFPPKGNLSLWKQSGIWIYGVRTVTPEPEPEVVVVVRSAEGSGAGGSALDDFDVKIYLEDEEDMQDIAWILSNLVTILSRRRP
jgi:hypothetical protein